MADSYSINATFSLKDMFSGPLDKVKRGLQETSEQPKKLTASLMDIAKGAGAFAVISKGLDVVKDSVSSAVGRFDTLNAYPKVMKQMGYSTQDTQESIQLLKKGIDGLPTSLQDITKNAQSFAILTGSAKGGAQTANALNDAFLASGASAADASRGVQQYSQMLAAGKVDMQSWRTLTETMPYALNEVAKAFGFTGKSAQKDLYNALESGKITTDQLNQKFIELDGGVNGFANTARTATGGIGTSFTNMRNAVVNGLANTITAIDNGIKSAGVNGGIAGIFNQAKVAINESFKAINSTIQGAMPMIVGAIKQLWNSISSVINFVSQNKDWIMPMVVGVISATVAFKAFMVVMKTVAVISNVVKEVQLVVFAFNNVRASVGAAKAAMVAFNVATGANPIGAIALAVIAVVSALTWFFTQTKTGQKIWQGFVSWLSGAWNSLVEVSKAVWNTITEAFRTAVDVIKPVWSPIAEFFTNLWNGIVDGLKPIIEAIKNLWNSLKDFFPVLLAGIAVAFAPMIAMMTGTIGAIVVAWNFLVPYFQGIWQAIQMVIIPILSVIVNEIGMWLSVAWNVITTVFNSIMITIQTIWNIIVIVISTAWNNITTIISTAINVVANIIKLVTSIFTGDWSGAMQAISNISGAIWNGVTAIFSNSLNAIGGIVGQIGNWIVGQFNNAISGLLGIASSIFNGVRNTIKSAMNIDLLGAGKAIIDGLIDGVKSAWNTGKKIFEDITKSIPKLKGPYSYDKVLLTPAGNAIMDGLNNGIMNGYKTVKSNLSGMADDLESNFSGQLNANATQNSRNVSQIEVTANNSTNGLLREVVKAIREGQVITINGNQMIGATANGYDGALGDIMTDRRRNQL
ncbi:phage tape measure protein [Fructobacillus fructosus]|uniref:tape measure protein n=1 Tax=Fructobacillus fructosus TaxID=1631 RepID=UPI00021954FE|nr:tape measure protein [Fructobacillus fructosus]KRN51666.1 minor tail protein gp26-like protein [Fructobacillus fructosus KCTC 3544]GAP01930.1 phage tape measure protein [Fructobacillus fructosus]